jgi:hypothetical protein
MTRLILAVVAALSLCGPIFADEPASQQQPGDGTKLACTPPAGVAECVSTRKFFQWLDEKYPGLQSDQVKDKKDLTLDEVITKFPKIKDLDDFNNHIAIKCTCGDEALVLYAIKLKFYDEQLNKS